MRCADFPGHIRGDGHVPGRRFGTPILVSCATLTHVWLQTLVDEFGFGAVVELASDSSNVVDALNAGVPALGGQTVANFYFNDRLFDRQVTDAKGRPGPFKEATSSGGRPGSNRPFTKVA